MSGWNEDTTVLIPAYCAAQSLRTLLPRLLDIAPVEHILVVDDGSCDDTPAVCAEFEIDCTAHERNMGKGAALRTGLTRLGNQGYRWAITMDADGQHTVEDIQGFLDATSTGPNPCLWIGARRIHPDSMPLARVLSNTLTSRALSLLCGQRILDSQSGYRAYPLDLVKHMHLVYDRFETESEVILRVAKRGCPVRFVPIRTVYSGAPSHISHLRDTLRWIRAVSRVWLELHRTQ